MNTPDPRRRLSVRSAPRRGPDLSAPRDSRGLGLSYDPDAFGRFAESVARYFGTARFLVIQSLIVVLWIAANVALVTLRWDPYPFILLNLAFSTQAAYAAPLILLAQNRQEIRDRAAAENDRKVAERTQADAEFLAREIASVRVMLSDVVTTQDLREQLDDVARLLADLRKRLDQAEGAAFDDTADSRSSPSDADPTAGRSDTTESTAATVASANAPGSSQGTR
jgi:uncharacterized membrane protein